MKHTRLQSWMDQLIRVFANFGRSSASKLTLAWAASVVLAASGRDTATESGARQIWKPGNVSHSVSERFLADWCHFSTNLTTVILDLGTQPVVALFPLPLWFSGVSVGVISVAF